MAKQQTQQEEPLKTLYTVLHDDELYTKSFDEFKSKYSTPEEVDKLYNIVASEQYYTKDIDSFKEKYFPKSNEGSQQGSENTSVTSTEPLPPSQDINVEEQYAPTTIPEQRGLELAQRVDPATGEVTYGSINLQETGIQENLPKLSFQESVSNTVDNIWNAVKSALPQTSLSANQIISKALGEDTLNWLNKLGRIEFSGDGITFVTGEDAQTTLNKTLQSLDELEQQQQRTVGTLGEIENVSDLGAYVVDAVGSLASTVLISAPTAGSGLLTSMVGGSIKDYNKIKAERLGVTEEELYKSGKADTTTPLLVGSLGFALEKVGLKGITNVINRGVLDGTLKSFLIVAKDVNQEGMTEWVQLGLDTYNTGIASGLSVSEATEQAAYTMGSKEGLEAYAKGVVGSGVAGGAGRLGKKVFSKNNRVKANEMEKNIQSSFQDLANDNVSPETKSVIAENLSNTVEQLDEVSTADNAKIDKLTDSQRQDLENTTAILESTERSLQDPNISEPTRKYLEQRVEELSTEVETKLNAKPEELTNEQRINEINTVLERNNEQLTNQELDADTRQTIKIQNEQLQEELNTLSPVQQNDVFMDTEQEDLVNSEVGQSDQVVGDIVADTTFWQDLTNSENRATRLTTLEERIKQNFQNSGNLGIASNSAREQAKQMRDLTEYAILKIADGTIKTAQAFTEAVKGLGITNEDVAKQAYYNATTSAEQYSQTNPDLLSIQRRAGEVIVNIQEGRKSDATTKVTAKNVKAVTEGKMQGTVTLTNKQALKSQISTLNRGIKEGIKQAKGKAKESQAIIDDTKADLQNTIKSMNTSEIFKGVKVPASAVQRLTANLNKAKTRTQLMRFTEDFQKFVDDVDHFNKVDKSRTLKAKIKKLTKRPKLPVDLKQQLKDIGNIDERYINDLESFNQLLEDVSKLLDSPTTRLTEATFLAVDDANRKQRDSIKKLIEKASAEYKRNKIESLKERLEAEGIDTTTIEQIYSGDVEAMLQALQEAYDSSTNKESKSDKYRASAKVYQTMLDEVDTSEFDARALADFKAVQDLDIDQVSDNAIVPTLAGLANLVNNGSLTGLGTAITLSKLQQNNNNTGLINKAKKAFRDTSAWFNTFVNKTGTGSVRIVNNINNIADVNAMNELTGLTDLKITTRKVYNRLEQVSKGIEDILKKYKKDFDNPVNNVILGIYRDASNYRESWSMQEIENEYGLRIEAWAKSLDLIKRKADKNTQYARENKYYIANLEKALDKIKGKTREEVFQMLPKGLQEFSKFADKQYDTIKPELLYNASVYNNQEVEDDLVNYSPRMYKTLSISETEDIGDKATSLGYNGSLSEHSQFSGSGKSRSISGNKLPANKVLDPDFIGRFKGELGKALYDIETQSARMYNVLALDPKTSPLIDKVGSEIPFIQYDKLIANKVADDIRTVGGVEIDKAGFQRLLSAVQKTAVAQALGGIGQILKQSTPLLDVSIRVKNPVSVATAVKQMTIDNVEGARELLKIANVASRDVQKILAPESKVQRADTGVRDVRSTLSKIGFKSEEINETLTDISLKPLQLTDKFIANIGWLSFYIDHQKSAGKAVTVDANNLDREAFDYADTMTSLVMNESDPSMRSELSKNTYVRYVMPFMSFAINAKLDLAINVSKALDKSNPNRLKALKALGGNLAGVTTFLLISYAIREATNNFATTSIETAIADAFRDDEDKKEELLALVEEESVARNKKNKIRTIGYAVNEFLTGGVAGQVGEYIFEPVVESASQLFYEQSEVQEAQQTFAKRGLAAAVATLGLYGIPIANLEELYKNGKQSIKSDEDFIKERYGVVTAEGDDIIVNDYRLDPDNINNFNRPQFSKNIRDAAFLASVVSTTGLSSQEVRSYLRNLKYYETKVVDKLRGRASAKEKETIIKDAIDLSKVKVGDKEIKLTPEQLDQALKIREQELAKLKKDPFVIREKKMLTAEEYNDFLRDEATAMAKAQIIEDMNIDYKQEDIKEFSKMEEQEKLRERMLKYGNR